MSLKIEKIITSIFFLYLLWFKEAYITINGVLYGTVICLSFLVGLDAYRTKKNEPLTISGNIKMFFILLIYSFFTGMVICSESNSFIDRIIRLAIFSIICLDCEYISKKDGSNDWLLNIFVMCAVVCAMQTIFKGVSYNGAYIYTMGRNNNPNKLGLTMVWGVISLLYDIEKFKKKQLMNFILLLLFLYIIMLTASRKCFIAVLLVLIVWMKDYIQALPSNKKIFGFVSIAAFAVGASVFILKNSDNTSLFHRLSTLGTGEGTHVRLQLYREAFDMWKSHPVFGIGYSQFQEHNSISIGYYSHSTYAELLCCTGIIGVAIFFIPIFNEVKQCAHLLILATKERANNALKSYKLRMLLLIFVIELFLATGQILIYEIDHMVILTFLFIEVDSFKICETDTKELQVRRVE